MPSLNTLASRPNNACWLSLFSVVLFLGSLPSRAHADEAVSSDVEQDQPDIEQVQPDIEQVQPDIEQDQPVWSARTLLGTGPLDHGGYGALLVRGSSLSGDPALFVGARGAWLIDHRFAIGLAGVGQLLNVDAPDRALAANPNARHVEFGYGGLYLGYHLWPDELVHPVFSATVGAGGLTLSDRFSESLEPLARQNNAVFVLEPEIAVEMNIIQFAKVQLTLSYRRVWGANIAGLNNSGVSGLAGGVAVVFGVF